MVLGCICDRESRMHGCVRYTETSLYPANGYMRSTVRCVCVCVLCIRRACICTVCQTYYTFCQIVSTYGTRFAIGICNNRVWQQRWSSITRVNNMCICETLRERVCTQHTKHCNTLSYTQASVSMRWSLAIVSVCCCMCACIARR